MTRTDNPPDRPGFRIQPSPVPGWPKLAWLAELPDGSDTIRLLHGPGVEATDRWAAEAVWCGDFDAGDFDRTDRLFGSGVRIRGRSVVFCCSGTIMDRLWLRRSDGRLLVSNSLAALCAVADVMVRDDREFRADTMTVWGSPDSTRTFPVSSGEVTVAWFCNLVWRDGRITPQPKPDTAPAFRTYGDYVGFLVDSARLLGENIRSAARKAKVTPMAAVSNGYDSPAVAWVVRHAGCEKAVTFSRCTSFWRGSDSGADIARRLGMTCRTFPTRAREYPHELAVWAACGRPSMLSLSLLEYPEPLSAVFLGNWGDSAWATVRSPYPYRFIDLGMGELRLWVGALQCVIPFWGARHQRELDVITFAREMDPWRLGGSYDRPIARRIVEEAGIPRGGFAVRKKDTSHEEPFLWPYSPRLRQNLAKYLQGRGMTAPPDWKIALLRGVATAEKLLYRNLLRKLGVTRRVRPWSGYAPRDLLVRWANEELSRAYRDALSPAGPVGADRAGR